MLFGKTPEKHPQIYPYRSCKIIIKKPQKSERSPTFAVFPVKIFRLKLQDIEQMKSELSDATDQIHELTHPRGSFKKFNSFSIIN